VNRGLVHTVVWDLETGREVFGLHEGHNSAVSGELWADAGWHASA